MVRRYTDVHTRTAVSDDVAALGLADEAAGILLVPLNDAARHVQVLDGGSFDVAEGGAVVVVAVVGDVECHGVTVAVEDAAELGVVAGADARHHNGVASAVDFGKLDVGRQLERLAAEVRIAVVDEIRQRLPVGGRLDQVGRLFSAGAGKRITLHDRHHSAFAFRLPGSVESGTKLRRGIVGRVGRALRLILPDSQIAGILVVAVGEVHIFFIATDEAPPIPATRTRTVDVCRSEQAVRDIYMPLGAGQLADEPAPASWKKILIVTSEDTVEEAVLEIEGSLTVAIEYRHQAAATG